MSEKKHRKSILGKIFTAILRILSVTVSLLLILMIITVIQLLGIVDFRPIVDKTVQTVEQIPIFNRMIMGIADKMPEDMMNRIIGYTEAIWGRNYSPESEGQMDGSSLPDGMEYSDEVIGLVVEVGKTAYHCLNDTQKSIYEAYLKSIDIPQTGWTGPQYVTFQATYAVTEDDLELAVEAATTDHPELFWCTGGFGYRSIRRISGEENIVEIAMNEPNVTDYQQWLDEKAQLEDAVNQVLSQVDLQQHPAKTALQLHDILLARIQYDTESAATGVRSGISGSAYAALVLGQAVCEGYTQAYSYLLARCGIPSLKLRSDELNHAWNMVYLDNGNELDNDDWYEVDVTWDDQDYSFYQHKWYNLTSREMLLIHEQDGKVGSRNTTGLTALLPQANGTTYTYDLILQLQ